MEAGATAGAGAAGASPGRSERPRAGPEPLTGTVTRLGALGPRWDLRTDRLAVLDERGTALTSPEFAQRLAGWRDAGRGDLVLAIGGADGIAPALRAEADFALSFGRMVWPHMLARVMLAEQLYRAATILAGSPYHRK